MTRDCLKFVPAMMLLNLGLSLPVQASPGVGEIIGTVKAIRLSVGSAISEELKPIVYLEAVPASAFSNQKAEKTQKKYQIIQKNKQFHPQIIVAPVGSRVEFPNEDTILHNVFSVTPGNVFDLGLYRRGEKTKSVTLKNSGIVSLYCNIHPQMVVHIVVAANKHYTEVNQDGQFRLSKVPVGRWDLVAWFPFGRPVRKPVVVTKGNTTSTDIIIRERRFSNQHLRKDGTNYSGYGE